MLLLKDVPKMSLECTSSYAAWEYELENKAVSSFFFKYACETVGKIAVGEDHVRN